MPVLLDSPLMEWIREEDRKNWDKDDLWYYDYYCIKLFEKMPNFVYSMLLKDWEYRADNQLNVVASVEGELGTGKSLGTLGLALKNGEIFLKPLDPYDILVSKAIATMRFRSSEPRTTFIVDEQDQKNVGLMANTIDMDLKDFEIQGRYTQKNIFWISKDVINHPHIFVFETERVNRVSNPLCNSCKYYRGCKINKYETKCNLEPAILKELKLKKPVLFNERTGYPVSFQFILKIKRKREGILFPRGRIVIPMVEPETAKKYDEIKQKTILRLENMDNEGMDLIDSAVKSVFDKTNELMIIKQDVIIGKIEGQKYSISYSKPAPAYQLQSAFYSVHGLNKFPQKAVPLIIQKLRNYLIKVCGELNNQEVVKAKEKYPNLKLERFKY